MKLNWAEQMEYGQNRWDGMEQAEHYGTSRRAKRRYNVIFIRKTLLLTSLLSYYKVCFTFIMENGAGFSGRSKRQIHKNNFIKPFTNFKLV